MTNPALADRRRIAAGTASIQVREAYQQGRQDGAEQTFQALVGLGVPAEWMPTIINFALWLMEQQEEGVQRCKPVGGGYLRSRFGP